MGCRLRCRWSCKLLGGRFAFAQVLRLAGGRLGMRLRSLCLRFVGLVELVEIAIAGVACFPWEASVVDTIGRMRLCCIWILVAEALA